MRTIALCALVFLLTLAARAEEAAAVIKDDLYVGQPLVVDNVTVWAVYSKREMPKLGDFVTLEEAQKNEKAVVRERRAEAAPVANQEAAQQVRQSGGDAATVNELVIENKGEQAILVLAGTLVKGGKQDRQIAQDFIIPAGKTVGVDAFCVERGRWQGTREGTDTKGVFEVQKSLTASGVRYTGQNKADQGEVWRKVAEENGKAGKAPSTGTYQAVVEETDKDAVARREKLAKAIEEKFAELEKKGERPLGVAYAVDGKVREIRSFAQPEIYQRYRPILVNTIAIEGDLAQRQALAKKEEIYNKAARAEKIPELVKKLETVKEEQQQTKAGNVIRFQRDASASKNDCYVDPKSKSPVTSTWAAAE
ncbi:MAG TPA: DUF6569 family protein [Planctomycetota bacterium]|nr:DUF6569 family protein [Planctomycetota bacterium]